MAMPRCVPRMRWRLISGLPKRSGRSMRDSLWKGISCHTQRQMQVLRNPLGAFLCEKSGKILSFYAWRKQIHGKDISKGFGGGGAAVLATCFNSCFLLYFQRSHQSAQDITSGEFRLNGLSYLEEDCCCGARRCYCCSRGGCCC